MKSTAFFHSFILSLFILCFSTTALALNPRDKFLYRLNVVNSQAPLDTRTFLHAVTYVTAGGFTRTVPIAVRKLVSAGDRPLPVVVWAHGGGPQPTDRDPATVMEEWSKATARAGYLSVSLLHVTNSISDHLKLCEAIGYPTVSNPTAVANAISTIANAMAGGSSLDIQAIISQFPDILSVLEDQTQLDDDLENQVISLLTESLNACRLTNSTWDRPNDIQAVIDLLHNPNNPFASQIDTKRIAVAGHSNGTNTVLGSVGLSRTLPNGTRVSIPFPAGHAKRPVAVVALSPQGPNGNGIYDTTKWKPTVTDSKDHSWVGLTNIPVFTVTGDGDERCKPQRFDCADGDSGSTRTIPFLRMPAGNKYLMYVNDQKADEIVSSHEVFGTLLSECAAQYPQQCEDTRKWLISSVLAFLDAHVLNVKAAKTWLASNKLDRASKNIAHIDKR